MLLFVLHESDKSVDLNMYIFKSLFFSFSCSKKYNVFEFDFLLVCGIHNWLHLRFFHIFLKHINSVFEFFRPPRSLVFGSTKSPLQTILYVHIS